MNNFHRENGKFRMISPEQYNYIIKLSAQQVLNLTIKKIS